MFLPSMTPHMANFENNKNAWKERIEFYEEELSKNVCYCRITCNLKIRNCDYKTSLN